MSSTSIEKVNGTKLPETSHAESWARAGIADAEAEAIRARTAADVEALRIEAEAKAEAIRINAAAEAEKQRLVNERAALRFEREKAEQLAKIAEANRKRAEAERLAAEEREAAEVTAQEQADAEQAIETATGRWRKTAKGFYALCATVALPVQMAAFYDPKALYLLVAPVFIEVIALVALVGAAAAVTARRPHWHYRLVAWAGAFTAATINLVHGFQAFDAATAFGTALASLAGPGMWDLHEHGRIARRDGVPTRRERKAAERAEKRHAAQREVAEEKAAAEREATRKAAEEAAARLAADREKEFPKVWAHAIKLAAALGEADPNAVWRRAHIDIEGVEPGDSVDIIRGRNMAERRVLAARSEAPGGTPVKAASSQRASQMQGAKKPRVYNPPTRRGVRTKNDTPKYVSAARKQAAIAARTAASEESK